jgi:hypothetical protein
MIAKFYTNRLKVLHFYNSLYTIKHFTPKGLNIYKNICAEKSATPLGSNIVSELFFINIPILRIVFTNLNKL